MTTEQLAIIVSALVAVVSLGTNAWLHNRVTQRTLDHQRTMARDERVQGRRASTYEDLLEMIGWVMEIVDATHPLLEPGPKPPPEPDPDRIRHVQARIGAHGSPETKAILEKWAMKRGEFFGAASRLTAMREAEDQGVTRSGSTDTASATGTGWSSSFAESSMA